MFTTIERHQLRDHIVEHARADVRITGIALTGSASVGKEDEWSDIDLAFGVSSGIDISEPLNDFTNLMYDEHCAIHHLDVPSGSWIYRVFLLESTLQVDLAFAPEEHFGAIDDPMKDRTFKLISGRSVDLPIVGCPDAELMIGYAWLYALHARSCIARGKACRQST